MKKRLTLRPDSEIPTSSMADIAFLLIIFFLVTSVFATTKGLELRVSPDETQRVEPDPAVFVQVRAGGILVDCHPMQPAEIPAYLEPILTRNPNKPVVVYTYPDAEYRDFVEVYDVLARAGEGGPGWSLPVGNISIPTSGEIAAYVEAFGTDPFSVRCEE